MYDPTDPDLNYTPLPDENRFPPRTDADRCEWGSGFLFGVVASLGAFLLWFTFGR